MSKAEKTQKAETFARFLRSRDVTVDNAWVGPTLPVQMVPMYLVLGPPTVGEGDEAKPNLPVLHSGLQLLASQALEASDACVKVFIPEGGRSSDRQGKWESGWMRAGNEGLVGR